MLLVLNARFPSLRASQELNGELTPAQVTAFLQNATAVIEHTLYAYAPVDEPALTAHASKKAAGVKDLFTLAAHVSALKLSQLEKDLEPFVRETRSPEFLLEKKCDPALFIAECAYFRVLYEQLYPPRSVKQEGAPEKNEFRFAAQLPGWTAVRKVNLDVAEPKEVFASLVATRENASKKLAEYASSPNAAADASALEKFLSRFPGRRSLARLSNLLAALAKEKTLDAVSAPFRPYFLQRVFQESGFPPYGSIELVNGVYPELKIPKPRGRLKKG